MRITHVVSTIDPANGGPPAVAVRLAAAQAGLGHKTSVVSFGRPGEFLDSPQYSQIPNLDLVSFEFVEPHSGSIGRIAALHARGRMRQSASNADILHLHGLWNQLVVYGAVAAKNAGIPYVVRPAGVLDPWSLQQKRLKKRIALALLWRRIVENAAFVHVLNEAERIGATPTAPKARFRVFPNGVFLEEFEPPPPLGTFRKLHPAVGAAPFVLFLGRLHHKKGLDILADAFFRLSRRLPHPHLVVAGPDQGEKASFNRAIAKFGLQYRVHVVGPLWGPEKLAALTDAAVFCLPSRQEGFSVAITEALAAGCPVVVSRECHFPEVSHAQAGIETSLSPRDVSEALGQILSNVELAKSMTSAATDLVRKNYTWPSIARRLANQYSEAIDHPKAAL